MIDKNMDFKKLALLRHSVRCYQPKPIEREKLDLILEAGRLAPSAVNFQPWHFIVIRQEDRRQALWECYPREWFKTAPAYIIICGDHHQSWKRNSDQKDHCDIDAAIAIDHMTLQAAALGLGSCWVCNFDPKKLRNTLHLPPNIEPIAILPLGYADEKNIPPFTTKKRKPLIDLVHWENF